MSATKLELRAPALRDLRKLADHGCLKRFEKTPLYCLKQE